MDLRRIKSWLGVLPQEYLCVAREDVSKPPSVHLTFRDSTKVIVINDNQLLLGYNPLVMAVRVGEFGVALDSICLNFSNGAFNPTRRWRGFHTDASCIGRIEMKKLMHPFDIPGWNFFTGVHGEHDFLNLYQRFANEALAALRTRPPSNANISGNLYEQVRIAYATPRRISVITVQDNDLLNFFPTDLHGQLDSIHYVSSLRIGGMACDQVSAVKRIVISTVNVSMYRQVYALGKNHMRGLQPSNHFPEASVKSSFGIPVYPLANGYLELEIIDSFDIGIHRIFLYRILEDSHLVAGKTLAHIHAHYLQWRINNGLSTEYFLR